MTPFETEYQISVSDYRKATFYALFLRHRRALQIMFIVLIGAVIYAAGAMLGLGEVNPLVFFLAGAYLIWGLVLFAGAERSVLQYMKSTDSFLGCRYIASFDRAHFRIRIKEKNIDNTYSIRKLACAFEISSMFLLYTTPQEVFMVPVRALTGEQRSSLRDTLAHDLKDRFASRFLKKS